AIFYLAKCLIYYRDEMSYSQRLITASDTQGRNRKLINLRYLSLQDAEITFLTCYVDNNSNGADRMPKPGVCNSREIHET
ncbi:hypothetical protein C2638_004226, partial [Salmonella enterica subsp. enterica serovar 4,[5],12:i:-]|nr:hypothetical protein [Salmonella enterica]EDS1978864.1 hypothetical protein [Salmonella enterica subsp. enterica serovar 4,[5],12:i:-]EDV4717558.1 hypothetical protein [Salmonella enterica subsp. enterica serovar Infantis]EAY6014780.1 hypothetical protein [Salmonella enterica]ECG9500814.1 hypothetical protein [Salmonella enterica]